jgi:hypothetical protein
MDQFLSDLMTWNSVGPFMEDRPWDPLPSPRRYVSPPGPRVEAADMAGGRDVVGGGGRPGGLVGEKGALHVLRKVAAQAVGLTGVRGRVPIAPPSKAGARAAGVSSFPESPAPITRRPVVAARKG